MPGGGCPYYILSTGKTACEYMSTYRFVHELNV